MKKITIPKESVPVIIAVVFDLLLLIIAFLLPSILIITNIDRNIVFFIEKLVYILFPIIGFAVFGAALGYFLFSCKKINIDDEGSNKHAMLAYISVSCGFCGCFLKSICTIITNKKDCYIFDFAAQLAIIIAILFMIFLGIYLLVVSKKQSQN